MARIPRDRIESSHSLEPTAELPFATGTAPDTAPAPPPAPIEPGPSLAAEKRTVVVATTAGQPRVPKYRVLKDRMLSHRAQQIRFKTGSTFYESKYPAGVVASFVAAGLELEQIE